MEAEAEAEAEAETEAEAEATAIETGAELAATQPGQNSRWVEEATMTEGSEASSSNNKCKSKRIIKIASKPRQVRVWLHKLSLFKQS